MEVVCARIDAPVANDRLLLSTKPANDGYGRYYIAVDLPNSAAMTCCHREGMEDGMIDMYVCMCIQAYGRG